MCVSMNVYGLRSTILSLFTDFSIGQVKATIQASVVHITYITKKIFFQICGYYEIKELKSVVM